MLVILGFFVYFLIAAIVFYFCQLLHVKKRIWIKDSNYNVRFQSTALSVLWPILVPVTLILGLLGKVLDSIGNALTNLAQKHGAPKSPPPPVLHEESEPGYRNPPSCKACGRGEH